MAELVYPPVVLTCKAMFRVLDIRLDVQGTEHIPRHGGAVIACTHQSYLDFIFCGLGALPAKRLVRFMAKQEVFANRIAGPLMRGMRHIPVDRDSGRDSFDEAVRRLRAGEVVGVFPKATISRSFTVKELKSGATRMATDAGVPLVPMAVWGPQRLWTKGRAKNLTQRHVPVSILAGEPIPPDGQTPVDEATTQLRSRMQQLLDTVQSRYPATPQGEDDAWWLPAHLGGSAPNPGGSRRAGPPRSAMTTPRALGARAWPTESTAWPSETATPPDMSAIVEPLAWPSTSRSTCRRSRRGLSGWYTRVIL